ncbi:MAG: hypothetical protein EA343_14195 [Nodularia sp. (in: Bacteria)]|nr:MAG: hypothetical protein EA343_14195 [Nodularia sp. (in: cyanobacteria)]
MLIALTFGGCGMESAQALLWQHHDSPGVLRYHSQISIKDEKGYAWQVLLSKWETCVNIPDFWSQQKTYCGNKTNDFSAIPKREN